MNRDIEHLRLLSIFHYIGAGLAGLYACFPVIYVVIGLVMVFAPGNMAPPGGPPPEFLGWFLVAIGFCASAVGLTAALLLGITGRFLSQHRGHTFCTVVAAIECLSMPFGTILGVFTLVVLMRDTVRVLFATGVSPQPTWGGYQPAKQSGCPFATASPAAPTPTDD